jgi:hypothetical protein
MATVSDLCVGRTTGRIRRGEAVMGIEFGRREWTMIR